MTLVGVWLAFGGYAFDVGFGFGLMELVIV